MGLFFPVTRDDLPLSHRNLHPESSSSFFKT